LLEETSPPLVFLKKCISRGKKQIFGFLIFKIKYYFLIKIIWKTLSVTNAGVGKQILKLQSKKCFGIF
jgi:hypothetical protein